MAQQIQNRIPVLFSDKRIGRGFTGSSPVTGSNYGSRNLLESYLSGQGYTAKQIQSMTHNDLVMAARRIQDNAGIR